MRVDVKKFLFLGFIGSKDPFFQKAQKYGIIHFIKPKESHGVELLEEVQNLNIAIKILRGLPVVEQEEIEEKALAPGIAHKIIQLRNGIEKIEDEIKVIKLEIARIQIFGDFSLKDLAEIEKEGNRKIQFFFAKSGAIQEIPNDQNLLYIGTDQGLEYFVSINPTPVAYEKMIEIKIEKPLGELQKRLEIAEHELDEKQERLKTYAKYNDYLHQALIHYLNAYHLIEAENFSQTGLEDSLFSVEGWVPENKLDQLEHLLKETKVHGEEVAVLPEDPIPTYLENEKFSRIGQDLVEIYDTPSNTDKDPSLWVLGAFSFFFAIIVGDGGYGLIFLAIALFLWYKFPKLKGLKKRILTLFTMLSAACVIWGVLTASFFGIAFDFNSPIRDFSLMKWLAVQKMDYHLRYHDEVYQSYLERFPGLAQVSHPVEFIGNAVEFKDGVKTYPILSEFSNGILLELALFIGVIHLIISLIRYMPRSWAHIGWIMFLIGGYLYFPYYLNVPSLMNYVFNIPPVEGAEFGFYMMIGGIITAWILSIFQNGLGGLPEIMNLIQVFADVMSYLRLYALALAGAIVSETVNEMAGGIPLFFGIILIAIGHSINMVLAIMGGVIHGLRLNFLEWYHYSFEGGGKKFRPLKLLNME